MKFRRRRAGVSREDENPYWISFSDLMSALLLIFILAVVVLIMQLMQAQDELGHQQSEFSQQIGTLQTAEQVREEILVDIQTDLAAQGIQVTISENNTVLSIPSGLLGFDSASYEIKPDYRRVASLVGQSIARAISEGDRLQYLDTVFIEGHTDNTPYKGLEGTGNWGLSTFRAISLWTFWSQNLPQDARLDFVAANGSPLFSVSGYADTRPAAVAEGAAYDLAKQRRIDIRFTIVRPSSEDLIDIRDTLEGLAGQ